MAIFPDCQGSCYSLDIQDSLAIIEFSGDIYDLGTCLDVKAAFLSVLRSLNKSPEIRALLFLNSPGVLGDEGYCRFMSNAIAVREGRTGLSGQQATYSNSPIQLERMTNTFNQIFNEILKFRKLLIVGFEGDVAAPFFGVSLAADYRFGSDGMTFQPSHIKLGLPPSGGLGFLLPRFVGTTKTRDLLFSADPTSANDLKAIGLLDDHFSNGDFRHECTRIAKDSAKMPLNAIMSIKSISNPYSQKLMAFLEYEEKTTSLAIARQLSRKGRTGEKSLR